MVNIVANLLIAFSIGQILLGILTILGKFDPLLKKERKILPAKMKKKARMLNAISMIVTSAILILLGAGLLLNNDVVIMVSAVLMAVFIIVMLLISLKVEGKYIKKNGC